MADCFAIFEGGGAKGLAHVGVLKAAELRGLKFLGVAGASAGAIIAALVAAGFKADELFDPGPSSPSASPRVFAGTNWVDILGAGTWQEFKRLKAQAGKVLPAKGSPSLGTAWRGWRFKRKWGARLEAADKQRGFFSTAGFEVWFNGVLQAKLGIPSGAVTFDQLFKAANTIPLKLVSVDIEAQKLVTFSHSTSPDMAVAKAVAASISIPFFFAPTMVDGRAMVDGGLMSNFPAWLFEAERAASPPFIRTYGFTLIEEEAAVVLPPGTLQATLDYASHVLQTGVFGGQTLMNDAVEFFQIIPIKTRFKVLDFELTNAEKIELYGEGRQGADNYFNDHGVIDDAAVTVALKALSDDLRRRIGAPLPGLRANVILPVRQTHLRVAYSYNMHNDTDDRLLMLRSQTGSGEALAHRQAVSTNVRLIRAGNTIRGLTKYDTALVRRDLICLISIPIFKTDKDWGISADLRSDPRGILSFDCNEDILKSFNQSTIQHFFVEASIVIGRLLRGETLEGPVQ